MLRAYWPRLVADQKHLSAGERETFAELLDAVEPPKSSGLVGDIIEMVAKAEREADVAERGRLLVECERRLKQRWWWPFGPTAGMGRVGEGVRRPQPVGGAEETAAPDPGGPS